MICDKCEAPISAAAAGLNQHDDPQEHRPLCEDCTAAEELEREADEARAEDAWDARREMRREAR